jgi:ribosomal peptide maturation radical SAM protein 1
MRNVLLVNMPFVSVSRPAIGVSILKARLAQEGIECDVAYPNLMFAELVGMETYHLIDEKINLTMFVGDWLFAQYLFGENLDLDTYLNTLRHFLKDEEEFNKIHDLRGIIGPFLKSCMDKLKIEEYGIVGFTTTFQQNLASLALAHKIKTEYPDKTIVFGGANCEGIMGVELHRGFPWIDYVCSGESDYTFPELVKAIGSGRSVKHIQGIVYRDWDSTISTGPAQPIHDMDQIPVPDYDDYFQALGKSALAGQISPNIPVENSRGCWWGARSQCTFCGLNGETMNFRSKSASRVLGELRYLKERYKINAFTAVDNIMDMKYFKDLLPVLKNASLGISMFYEVKANLNKKQVQLLSDAGVHAIQPGIESLNSHVLKLMRKGVTALQNVQLLKWCRQYGVNAAWNFLYGFPGEAAEDYEQMAKFMDNLCHLSPPYATGTIRLDRFSPYFNNPEDYGITGIKPFFTYGLIYPLPPEQVFNLAYFFQYEYEDGRGTQTSIENVLEKIDNWKRNKGGELIKHYGHNPELMLLDTRPNRCHSQVALNGIQREIYDYCDTKRSFRSIMGFARSRYEITSDFESWLQQFLGQMVDWRFMITDNGHYLNLAIEKEG